MSLRLRWILLLAALSSFFAFSAENKKELWVLKPVVRPQVPAGLTKSTNPIDAFIAAEYKKPRACGRSAPADKRTLLRRVYLDLIGIPPTPAEQDAFLKDESPDAYEKVVDHLLASEQHGVRYARHWLDVLRYADADERMTAAAGIHFWRDWVINALNNDMPYDQFVRAQLTGYRTTERTQMSAIGVSLAARAAAGRHVRPRIPGARRRGPRRQEHAGDADHGGGDGFHRVHGPDGGLRQVPRPHVRPDHAARLLRA